MRRGVEINTPTPLDGPELNDLQQGGIEVAVETIRALLPGAEVVGQWHVGDELILGSGLCKDCGDPLNQSGLTQRCRGRHQVVRA
jgi:hypothetical protein